MMKKKMVIEIPNIWLHILALPILPLILVVLVILWIVRQAVKLYLQRILGDNFGGLVSAGDRIYIPHVTSRRIVSSLVYIRSDTKFDFMGKFRDRIEEKVFKKPDHYPKTLATYHSFLGQDYMLKNRVTIDEIVHPMPLPTNNNVAFDEEYLKEFLGKISNSPLPKNGTTMMEVFIGTDPIENFAPSVKGYVYPILFRFHHTLADGARLVAFFAQVFSDEETGHYYENLNLDVEKMKGQHIFSDLLNKVQYVLYLTYLLFISIVTVLQITLFKEIDLNAIHGPPLCGEKLIAWATEYDTERVAMVKSIKNRIPNTRFSDVVFACISASMFNFFKKHNSTIPKKTKSMVPILFFQPSKDKSKPVDLKNEFTFGLLDLPMVDPANFLKGLEEIKISMDRMRKDPTKDVLYWLFNHITAVVPASIQKIFSSRAYSTIISSVPGSNRIKLFADCELLSNISSGPNSDQTGITITILTYDNKFHICLLVDKALISEQEDAQILVDDTLRNMQLLNEESLRVYG